MAKIIVQQQNFVGVYEAIRERQRLIAQQNAQQYKARVRSGISPIVGPAGFLNLAGSVALGSPQIITPSTVSSVGIRNINYATAKTVANTKIYNPQVSDFLKPISSFVGLVLATLTGIMADPTGAISLLPRSLASLIERVFPGFAASMEATFKKYKIDALAHLPGQILGSVRNLITMVDAAITLPFIIIADLYQALMDLMQQVAAIIDEAMALVYNFLFGPGGLLDGLYITEILAILEEVSLLASEIGALAGVFSGSNPITNFTNMIQNYAGQIGSFIQNPFDTLFAYAPPQVSQALYLIRNPQQMINSILPPQLSEMFKQVSAITGFGFNGNMGYGFASVLQGLRGGVLNAILTNFASQYPTLTHLLGGLGTGGGVSTGGASGLFTNPFGQKTSAGGIVQPQYIPSPVLPNKPQTSGTGKLTTGQKAARLPDGRIQVTNKGGSTFTVSENYFKTLYPNERVP